MANIQNVVTANNLAQNGVTCKLWSASSFSGNPAKDDPLPSGSPLDTTTSGTTGGFDGSYFFTGVADGEYWVSQELGGHILYDYYNITTAAIQTGEIYVQNYPNPQAALNAVPTGGSVTFDGHTYVIDNSPTYTWTHPVDGTKYGLVVTDKTITIRGLGIASTLEAGANNVDVLTLFSTSGISTPTSYGKIQDLIIQNSVSTPFTGCKGLIFDRSRRNRVYNVRVDNMATGYELKTAWNVNFYGCYFLGGSTSLYGVNTANGYSSGSPTGQSHNFTWHGGEMNLGTANGVIGFQLGPAIGGSVLTMPFISGTTVEGLGTNQIGLYVRGVNRGSFHGKYWENQGSGSYDVKMDSFWRAITIENVERINYSEGNDLCIVHYRDRNGTSKFDVTHGSQGCNNVTLLNPHFDETTSGASFGNSDSARNILKEWERGSLRIIGANQIPWITTFNTDLVGQQLLPNPSMIDGALVSYTDLAIDGSDNTKVTSAAHPFDGTAVGGKLKITSGSGSGNIRTVSSVSGVTATLSGSAGTAGATGITGQLDRLANWSLGNMSIDTTTVAPGGYLTSLKNNTNSATNNAAITPQISFTNAMRGRTVALSTWVNIPDTTWQGFVELNDGGSNVAAEDRTPSAQISDAWKDGNWHLFTCVLKIRTNATGFQAQVRFISPGSGTAYFCGLTMTFGTVPIFPPPPPDHLPSNVDVQRDYLRPVQQVSALGQIDPANGRVQKVRGVTGASGTTLGTGSATFAGSGTSWGVTNEDGRILELVGTDSTDWLTLTTGGSSKLILKGGGTRQLNLNSRLILRYDHNQSASWVEIDYLA